MIFKSKKSGNVFPLPGSAAVPLMCPASRAVVNSSRKEKSVARAESICQKANKIKNKTTICLLIICDCFIFDFIYFLP